MACDLRLVALEQDRKAAEELKDMLRSSMRGRDKAEQDKKVTVFRGSGV